MFCGLRYNHPMLSQRLKTARALRGMSQQSVALSLNPPKHRQSIGQYESGHDEPSLGTVEQLAAVLNVTPCWLAFGDIHRAQ